MTRRDFVLIADVLKGVRPPDEPDRGDETILWRRTVKAFASALHNQNAGFNYDRFIKACGLEE
jgi:hypothetical protein